MVQEELLWFPIKSKASGLQSQDRPGKSGARPTERATSDVILS